MVELMELKKEDKLLLKCLCAVDDQGKFDGLEHVGRSDWDLVIQQSLRHSVTPMLYRNLGSGDSGVQVPVDIMEKLRASYFKNAAKYIRLFHELSKVLQLLKDSGIPVIVLKGVHLAELVYGKIGLRTMCDVDLLFNKRDLSRAQRRLMEAGYGPLSTRLPLDIHWNIDLSFPPLSIDIEGVWERAQSALIEGVEVFVLSPEDLLLHLCTHVSFHHMFQINGLRTLCDIRETLWHYKDQIDWAVVQGHSMEWGIGNSIYLTLMLARDLLNAEVPNQVLERFMNDDFNPHVKTWTLEQIFNHSSASLNLSPHFLLLWHSGSFREKVSHLLKLIFPSPEFVSQAYPAPHWSPKNYLYYFVRLKDHLSRYCRATWRILARDEEMRKLVREQNQNLTMRGWLSS